MATTPVVKQRINNPCYNQKMFSLSDDRFEGTTKVVNVFRAFTIEHLEKEPLFQNFIFFLFWIRIIKLSMILKIGSSASHSFL